MLSYDNFINESTWNHGTTFTYYKKGSTIAPFRVYYFSDAEYGKEQLSKVEELEDLTCIQENVSHTSNNLLILLNDEGWSSMYRVYDAFKQSYDIAVKSFLESFNRQEYPGLYELHDHSYLEFGDYDARLGNNHKFLIMESINDNDSIGINRNPEKYYPLVLKGIRESDLLNDVTKDDIEFKDSAEGYEESDHYRSLTSGNKFKLFDYNSYNESLVK